MRSLVGTAGAYVVTISALLVHLVVRTSLSVGSIVRKVVETADDSIKAVLRSLRDAVTGFFDAWREARALELEERGRARLTPRRTPPRKRLERNAVQRGEEPALPATGQRAVGEVLQLGKGDGEASVGRAAELAPESEAALFEVVADFERLKIIEALEASNWSQTDAAEMLHIPLSTLNQKIKRLDIQVKRRGV